MALLIRAYVGILQYLVRHMIIGGVKSVLRISRWTWKCFISYVSR